MIQALAVVAAFGLFFGTGYLWLVWYGRRTGGIWRPVVVTSLLLVVVVTIAVTGARRHGREQRAMLDAAGVVVRTEHIDSWHLTDRFEPQLHRLRLGSLEVAYETPDRAVITVVSRPTQDQYRRTVVVTKRVVDLTE